jgi:hypothetical protein
LDRRIDEKCLIHHAIATQCDRILVKKSHMTHQINYANQCSTKRTTTTLVLFLFLFLGVLFNSNPVPSNTLTTDKDATQSRKHKSLLSLLQTFHRQADVHRIPYRIEFGSLLGYVRAGRITKHDNDIDLLIDKSSLGVLDRLTNDPREPWYVDQRHHRPLPSSGASVFLHRTNHREDFSTVVRVDCNGNTTKNMRDACSFSGPVSRLVSFNASSHKPMAYIDVYVSGCPFHRPFGQYKSWHCRTATKSCSFCPSGEALNNSLVERSGGTLERCRFDGVETWCPSSRSWSIDYLSRLYGPSWQTVRKHWKYSDRPSKRRI